MTDNRTTNPVALRVVGGSNPSIKQPSGDVVAKQDPVHAEADVASDLSKAARRKSSAS
jgi:hypothetical protein